MGHHIDEMGRFQSNKYPELAPDKIVLSFKDINARAALGLFSDLTDDCELADDINDRLADYYVMTETERLTHEEYAETLRRHGVGIS